MDIFDLVFLFYFLKLLAGYGYCHILLRMVFCNIMKDKYTLILKFACIFGAKMTFENYILYFPPLMKD